MGEVALKGYIFVDDGYPEAEDYDSNFLCYDPADSESVRTALRRAKEETTAGRISRRPWPGRVSGKACEQPEGDMVPVSPSLPPP